MKALVTGASGFLGRHLCRTLRERGDWVVGLVRDLDPVHEVDVVTVIGSFDQVERAIAEYEIEVVFHLAAQTQVSTAVKDPIGTWEANVAGTWRVLEACRRQKVARIVVASSDKVYGDGKTPYREHQRISAGGVYATSKACADFIAQSYFEEYGMNITIARCGNLYGPGHTNWSTLIPGTIRSVLKGEPPWLRSNGGPRRDYLHVEDAVAAYLCLADGVPGRHVYNFGTGVATSAMEVVRAILRITGSDLEPIVNVGGSVPLEIDEQVLDASLVRDEMGWSPKHDLESGLANTIEWYRNFLGVRT